MFTKSIIIEPGSCNLHVYVTCVCHMCLCMCMVYVYVTWCMMYVYYMYISNFQWFYKLSTWILTIMCIMALVNTTYAIINFTALFIIEKVDKFDGHDHHYPKASITYHSGSIWDMKINDTKDIPSGKQSKFTYQSKLTRNFNLWELQCIAWKKHNNQIKSISMVNDN